MRIVIVGGGPAGATTARYLAQFLGSGRLGKKDEVLLVNYTPSGGKPCGGGIKTSLFSQFQIPTDPIITYPMEGVIHFSKSSHFFNSEKGMTPFLIPSQQVEIALSQKLAIVERSAFDQLLRKLAIESGAKLIEGRVIKGRWEKGKFWIEVRRGEEREQIWGDILIGADGVNSTIRKKFLGERIPAITTYFTTLPIPIQNCHFHFEPIFSDRFYGWVFPNRHGGHFGATSISYLTRLVEYYSSLSILKPIKGYNIPRWNGKLLLQKGKLFFVGDGAGQVLPTTFEGIYYAIASGKLLAEAIITGEDYSTKWWKRFGRRFLFFKWLEKRLGGNFRYPILSLFRLKWYRNFVIQIWNKE